MHLIPSHRTLFVQNQLPSIERPRENALTDIEKGLVIPFNQEGKFDAHTVRHIERSQAAVQNFLKKLIRK